MADKFKNQELTPQSNSEISIEGMISAPLVAASKANAEMMLGQYNFFIRNCFAKNDNGGYDPIMVKMSLKRSVIDNNKLPSDVDYITIQTMNFEVPVFCLIPINSLAIDKITIDFQMEITSTASWTLSEEDYENTGNRVSKKQAQLNGKISGDSKEKSQYSRDSSSKLKVHINASPLPLPLGILSILELYSKNINPVSTPKTLNS
jgi:hypothetical protein